MPAISSISNELSNIELHDATVWSIEYKLDSALLFIRLTLAEQFENAGQPSGNMVFYDVASFTADPPLEKIDWGEELGDVSLVQHFPNEDKGNLEAVRWYVTLMDRTPIPHGLVLNFLSSGFRWIIKEENIFDEFP